MVKKKSCHYTNFGVSMQPTCADSEGFLHYREGYEDNTPPAKWTEQEVWIKDQCERIDNWRQGNG